MLILAFILFSRTSLIFNQSALLVPHFPVKDTFRQFEFHFFSSLFSCKMKQGLLLLCVVIFAASSSQIEADKWDNLARSIDSIQKTGENETLEEEDQASDFIYEEASAYSEDDLDYLTNSTEPAKDIIKCQCGFKRSSAGKIVGGTVADDNTWPFMAAMVYTGGPTPKQFCGGSLINNLYVLTAAHCVQDLLKTGLDNFRIYLGTNQILTNSSFLQAKISAVRAHPKFDRKTLNYDMALLRLSAPVKFTEQIMPICLGQGGSPHVGRQAVVAGWGSLSETSSTVNQLRNVNVQVTSNLDCATHYSKVKIKITALMLCAGLPKKDSCKGDSGGPLFAKRKVNSPIYDQIGVVSFGQDCARPFFPGVYSRVGRFMKWIRENTKDATYCAMSFNSASA